MPTSNPVPSTDPSDLLFNAEKLDEVVNGTSATYTDRRGVQRRTLSGLEAEFPNAAANAAAAAASANSAAASAQTATTQAQLATTNGAAQVTLAAQQVALATTQAGLADTARIAAETARDAAQLSAGVYPTTTAGLSSTSSGSYFSVPSSNSAEYLILYQNNSGTAVDIKRYPSVSALEFAYPGAPIDYAFSVSDAEGNVALGVYKDGQVRTQDFYSESGTFEDISIGVGGSVVHGPAAASTVFLISDENDNVAFGIGADGKTNVASLQADEINGKDALDFIKYTRSGRALSHERNFVLCGGQSLSVGATSTAITVNGEYDSVVYNYRAIGNEIPVGGGSSGMEAPIAGTLGYIKELLAAQDGVNYLSDKYQLVGYVNGESATSITLHVKGTANYNYGISALTKAKQNSDLFGQTMAFQALTWTQGNADASMSVDTYVNYLKGIINDYNADAKAITGQYNDVVCITYQIPIFPIADAHIKASDESDRIFCSGPGYFFTYSDGVHLVASSYKWMGAYYGLVYKKVVIDKQDWQPLRPTSWSVRGNVIDLFFNRNGLTFDTTIVPAQTNMGFKVTNSGGTEKTVSSVSIPFTNVVRLTMAEPLASGDVVTYGRQAIGRTDGFSSACGNLRDRQGDTLVYVSNAGNTPLNLPMHNWSIVFNINI